MIHPHLFGNLSDPLDVEVVIAGPSVPPEPSENEFWGLVVETLPDAGVPDLVSPGEVLPQGYVESVAATRIVPFRLGQTISLRNDVADFIFAI